eukprot:TRINITY_DN4849_c0_g1_i2.p1 TRINITY_DN4849_c0_g1~~TRINITY_DN4849_c0_g1_i2.p1  ORF type:complete len:328 (+),score=44.75 TRINITY_DN4849_c0_g1_i2:107-1090(+)
MLTLTTSSLPSSFSCFSFPQEPAWEKAATIIAQRYDPEYDGRIRLAKVDCTVHQDLCRSHHVQGFPSLRIFRSGHDMLESHGNHNHESYYGERDTDSLVKFAESLVPAESGQRKLADKSGDAHKDVARKAPQAGGCNIEGFLLVKKVPGNLMVHANSGAHSFDPASTNLSHFVHSFKFGPHLNSRNINKIARLLPHLPAKKSRLERTFFLSGQSNVTHDHFLQVVKTDLMPLGESPLFHLNPNPALQSYDYTSHSHTLQTPNVPVARFHYELSPMQILISEDRRSFSHFITNLCAIIGGVFTVAGILDSVLHGAATVLKKVQLGKQY